MEDAAQAKLAAEKDEFEDSLIGSNVRREKKQEKPLGCVKGSNLGGLTQHAVPQVLISKTHLA